MEEKMAEHFGSPLIFLFETVIEVLLVSVLRF